MEHYAIEKAPSYHDQIYHSIKKMIFNGVFQPGERIYEAKIAREFQISRSPVREAVRSLEKEGLLIIDDKSRIMVYKPTIKDVEDIYECRQGLESVAARLTARMASSQELEDIEQTLQKTRQAIEQKKSSDVIISLNAQFHDLLLQFSQNRRLEKQLNDLRSLTYFYRAIKVTEEKRYWDVFNEHMAIFFFIQKREEEKAAEAMSSHIANDLNHLKTMLEPFIQEGGKNE